MKDLLEFIVKSLVTNPDTVTIEDQQQEGSSIFRLSIAPEDMGIIIGKEGKTIRAIRKLLTVRAIAENIRVSLELVDVSPNA